MKVVRSISALSQLIGSEAPPEELARLVREDMRRTLTAEERQDYHGITFLGYPHKMFSRLLNVSSAEGLVIAEASGIYFTPKDCPGQSYLFAPGYGVVAQVAPKMASQLASGPKKRSETRDLVTLDEEYKSLPIMTKDWEPELQEIAIEYVKWACN